MRNFHFKDPVIIYSLEEKANGLLTCLMYKGFWAEDVRESPS